jgi:hypothetical protein
MVRIGMVLTSKDVAYNNTLQTALDSLYLTKILDFKTNVGKDCCYLLG